jgi:hypothetical protein
VKEIFIAVASTYFSGSYAAFGCLKSGKIQVDRTETTGF